MQHYLTTLENSIRAKWDKPLLCNYRSQELTGSEIVKHIYKCGILFQQIGVAKGDKVALCASNTAHWAVSFLAANVYEAVVVPLLYDFHPDSITHLVDHSESVVLFTDHDTWQKLDKQKLPLLRMAICADDFSVLYAKEAEYEAIFNNLDKEFEQLYPNGIKADDVKFPTNNMEQLAVINYTSGTTSSPKGVMLSYKNFSASIAFGHKHIPVFADDSLVSMLPLAHVYGMVYEFLYPVSGGCTVYFLGKTPAPSYLLKAMSTIKPYMIATVPLVMEKIYKQSLKPVLSKPSMRILCAIPFVNTFIFNTIRKKLDAAFGGKVRNYIMGGAALNPEVEKWFKRIKLHYMVGYGMTEAAPILGYEDWSKFKKGSCGKAADCSVRIDSDNPHSIVGEILVKGDNITSGYFKNECATKASFTPDGYFRTGDLGVIDRKGNIFIRGRSKNMILTANGQNIYPEEIEAIINNQPYVVESLVVDRGDKLVALLYLDQETMTKDGMSVEDIAEHSDVIVMTVNKLTPAYSKLQRAEVVYTPFEKTPKMSIKRFLYR